MRVLQAVLLLLLIAHEGTYAKPKPEPKPKAHLPPNGQQCEIVNHVKLSKCQYVKMSECQNVRMYKCQNLEMSNCQIVKLSICQIVTISNVIYYQSV